MSEETAPTSRRQRYPRSAVRLPVRISTIDAETDPETGKPFFLLAAETCENLSRGGLFVATHEPMRTGVRLLVELEMPGGREVQAIGRVAWSRIDPADRGADERAGIGIEFLGGAPDDLVTVERYLERVAKRSRRTTAAPTPIPGAGATA